MSYYISYFPLIKLGCCFGSITGDLLEVERSEHINKLQTNFAWKQITQMIRWVFCFHAKRVDTKTAQEVH